VPDAPVIKRFVPRAEGVRSVALDEAGKRMVFAANGALFSQALEGVMARALVVPDRGWALSQPQVAHGRVLALAVSAGAPSFARHVVVVDGPRVNGNAFGVAAAAPVAVVLDVVEGRVRSVDLSRGESRDVCALSCAQDPMTPGVVAVRDDGAFALVMQASSPHADAALVQIDLARGSHERVHALAGPGWLAGGFAGEQVVVCEQRLGDAPRFRVLVDAQERLSTEALQQPCAPIAWHDDVALLLGSNGESSLVLLQGGAACPASGTRLRKEGDAIVVEGGRQALRITL
jgi:hypothetical protein